MGVFFPGGVIVASEKKVHSVQASGAPWVDIAFPHEPGYVRIGEQWLQVAVEYP